MTTGLTSILQWNIQGLSNKKDELIDLIHSNQSSIIAIQETKLSHDYLLKIAHFNMGPAFLKYKIDEVENIISNNKLHVFGISELNFKKDHKIEDYI